ncbi:MAG: PAS domain S-box protein, partial [Actinomycetota bacterium]
MEVALAVVTDLKIAVFAALGLVTLRLWRRHRGRAAGWVAATFGLAAVVASFGLVPTQEVNRHLWLSKTLVVGIILFPFLLYRFTAALGGPSRGADRLAVSLTALAVGWTLVVPRFPKGPGALRGWFLAYTLIALFQWTLLSLLVTIRLWRGGRGHPGVVLRRMQLLAFGATGIEVAIVIFALTPGTRAQALQFAHHFLALASFVFFYLGFSPPRPLRVTWRQPEVEAGRQAAQALMTVTDRREVTDIMGSSILAMLGARGVALMDTEGQLMWSWGVAPEMAQALARPSPPGGKSPRHAEDVIRVPSQMGCAVIWASPYTPFFGQEEIDLVRYQGVLGDLALERVELLEREREARLVAERAKTELESLLHRLREAEERYRAVFENAAEGMAQSAPDGRWVMVNPAMARMFGYGSPEELVTEVPDARQLWADPGRRKELLRLLASSDTVRDFAVEIRRKDGATVEISAGVAALRD